MRLELYVRVRGPDPSCADIERSVHNTDAQIMIHSSSVSLSLVLFLSLPVSRTLSLHHGNVVSSYVFIHSLSRFLALALSRLFHIDNVTRFLLRHTVENTQLRSEAGRVVDRKKV